MKESVVDVELVHRPVTLGGEMEYYPHGCRFNNGTVRLAIVNACALSEATDHQTSLVSIEAPIFLVFVAEDPFVADHVHSKWTGDEFLGAVDDQGVELQLHRLGPVRVFERLVDCSRDQGDGHRCCRGSIV
jgi:hypothetical protein